MEKWLPIPGYEGKYECSDYGNVRSLPNRTRRGLRTLTPITQSNGYLTVNLHKDGKQILNGIHRIVALTFLGPSRLNVNHKNGIKTDNRVENLEWLPQRENVIHYTSKMDRGGLPTGVHKFRNKYKAAIVVNRRIRYLGLFTDPVEAGRAYDKAKMAL